jgi:hypothetical protein
MSNMGKPTRNVGMAALVAAAALAFTPVVAYADPAPVEPTPAPVSVEQAPAPAEPTAAPASAEPAPAPAAGNVTYTLTTDAPYEFQLTYLVNQPANKAAYNADAYAYLKKDTVTVAPGAPWVAPANLADPQWAYFSASSTAKGGQGAPNAHCEISVNGQVVSQNTHPYSPRCQLSQW